MKKNSHCCICLLLLLLFILACGSSSVKDDDMSILTGRKWNSSKAGNSWTVIRFYRDLRGDIKNLTSLGLDQYQEYKFTWGFVGKDFTLPGPFFIRTVQVFCLSDIKKNKPEINQACPCMYYSF